jgi:hypothetical protein
VNTAIFCSNLAGKFVPESGDSVALAFLTKIGGKIRIFRLTDIWREKAYLQLVKKCTCTLNFLFVDAESNGKVAEFF